MQMKIVARHVGSRGLTKLQPLARHIGNANCRPGPGPPALAAMRGHAGYGDCCGQPYIRQEPGTATV
ncbi:hypothetical protein BIWAKO_02101 [Bosea sp. BIWAKO-01]|nr:hypothetical protein BIWAKO_02101 [Bosea sp. BIWAKO-01]